MLKKAIASKLASKLTESAQLQAADINGTTKVLIGSQPVPKELKK